MQKLPIVIVTTIVRLAKKGEPHGYIYLIDLESEKILKTIEWDDDKIDWEGRGGDRGLRGTAFYNDYTYIASGGEIFVLNQDFKVVKSYRNSYLAEAHEIVINDDVLYITSTGFDSILEFDLKNEKFTKGYLIRRRHKWTAPKFTKINIIMTRYYRFFYPFYRPMLPKFKYRFKVYDPNGDDGPNRKDTLHINSISVNKEGVFFSGSWSNSLMKIKNNQLKNHCLIPQVTHNAQPLGDKTIMNYTLKDVLAIGTKKGKIIDKYPVPFYDEDKLTNDPKDIWKVRQAWGRGFCMTEDNLYIIGSSPATVTAFKAGNKDLLKSLNITMDVRNTIFGVEVYPYKVSEID